MNTLNTVLLLIGLFILTPSMMYLFIYHVVNATVSYQKYKTNLIEYKAFAHMGVAFGLLVIAIPLLYIWLEFLKDFLPTLTQ